MKRTLYNIVFLISLATGFWVSFIGLARAQSPNCPGAALVQVVPGATLNVRALPGGVGQILGTVNHDSGELKATEEQVGFLHIEEGWIVNKYLSILCWGLGTPVAVTVIPLSPVPLATQTPQPTPTRIAAQLIYCASPPEVTKIESGLWRVACEYR